MIIAMCSSSTFYLVVLTVIIVLIFCSFEWNNSVCSD